MSEKVSQAEFARRVGKSKAYINKLVKQGKLILHDKKLDLKESKAILQSTKRASNVLGDKFNQEQKGKGAKKAATERTGKKKAAKATKEEKETAKTTKAMMKARLSVEENKAKIQELEYKKAIGELLPKEIVNKELAKVAGVVRSKLLAIPNNVAPIIINFKTSNEVKEYMTDTINDVLNEFQELSKTAVKNYKA